LIDTETTDFCELTTDEYVHKSRIWRTIIFKKTSVKTNTLSKW